ncbi:unnamed protein product [Calypogeia fissa]
MNGRNEATQLFQSLHRGISRKNTISQSIEMLSVVIRCMLSDISHFQHHLSLLPYIGFSKKFLGLQEFIVSLETASQLSGALTETLNSEIEAASGAAKLR